MSRTTEDLRAKAERVVWAHDQMEELLGPTDPVGPVDVAIEVCRAWLAEHPADDNESVSTAWLDSLGFISVAGADDDEMYTVYDGHGGPALTLESDDQRCWMAMLGDADGDVWPCDIHVRAQVRELLKALGVQS